MSGQYYSDHLSAARLKRVYELATPRIQQYLDSEIAYVLDQIEFGSVVLETGCGYGRVLRLLSHKARFSVGIDSSLASLQMARREMGDRPCVGLACMNAVRMGFANGSFDLVACIQNGLSAFHEDQRRLIKEAVRVTRRGGVVLFSSYSEKIWDERLFWFERQSEQGLLGEIDYTQTKDGSIVCKDGFTSTTITPDKFRSLTEGVGRSVSVVEVDESSVFCKLVV